MPPAGSVAVRTVINRLIPRTRCFGLMAAALAAPWIGGCGSAAETDLHGGARPDHPLLEIAATEVMRSDADSLLTSVSSLAVDSGGNIYLADWLLREVLVLSSQGSVLRSIGREGDGPGEFRRVSSVQLLPGDTLVVFDRALKRITVFAPGSSRIVQLAALQPGSGFLPNAVLRARRSAAYVVTYSRPFASWDGGGDDARRFNRLRLLDTEGGVIQDSLMEVPFGDALVRRVLGGVTVGVHPFGRHGTILLTPDDRIASVWNDSVGASFFTLDGAPLSRFAYPARGAPVAARELARMERQVSSDLVPALREWRPRSWPVLRGAVMDDRGRLWLGLNSERSHRAEWAAYDRNGTYLGSAFFHPAFDLRAIRGGFAYGISVDEDDVPSVVVYRLDEG